ncbi:MAG: type II secretion system protein GspK [Verrucomicrobiales bacterium]|nr:type II secretion system protein GspK [Verrucomicrobiales bacterium]
MSAVYRRRESGAAMIIVFWLVALLSLVIFTTVRVVKNDTDIMISQKKAFRATQLAEMGIAIGTNPVTKETDFALLNQRISDDESFEVRLKGEGGKFNINSILQQQDRDLLLHMFTEWGLEQEEVDSLIDALIDWVDADEQELLNGAEFEYYEELGFLNYPFNRPFYSVDEMRLVRGMEMVILLKPNWKDFFTIYSGGRLDLNEANAEAISLATKADIEDAQELVETRWGADGIEDTEDDEAAKLSSLGQAMAILGLTPDTEIFLNQRLTLNDATVRIESVGTIGDFRKKIVVVVRNRNNRPEILTREEIPLF